MALKKRLPRQKKSIKELPFSRLLPNMVTLLSLCVGLSAVRFALTERYEMAVIAILISSLLDALDGRLARALGASSTFGAELDSLSDMVCFGIAPSVVIYVSSLQEWNSAGWATVLLYSICSALRLARFNTDLMGTTVEPAWKKGYFKGVPMPSAAFIALMPMMISFAIDTNYFKYPAFSAAMMVLSALLMVSRLPTFSMKNLHISHHMVLPLMLGIGLFIIALINAFWFTLAGLGMLYLLLIPFSYRSFQKKLKTETDQ